MFFGFAINNRPAVAYDKDNDHVVITWNMTYNQSAWSSSFPIGGFPAQVYANPDYDNAVSSSDPSKQSLNGNLCNYNSIDNSTANSTSNGSIYVAVSSHNMNEMVYAWMDGNGDIRTKVVISGVLPRLLVSSTGISSFIHPNLISGSTEKIVFNVKENEDYRLRLYNSMGEVTFSTFGCKLVLEKQLLNVVKSSSNGCYSVSLATNSGNHWEQKLIILN